MAQLFKDVLLNALACSAAEYEAKGLKRDAPETSLLESIPELINLIPSGKALASVINDQSSPVFKLISDNCVSGDRCIDMARALMALREEDTSRTGALKAALHDSICESEETLIANNKTESEVSAQLLACIKQLLQVIPTDLEVARLFAEWGNLFYFITYYSTDDDACIDQADLILEAAGEGLL